MRIGTTILLVLYAYTCLAQKSSSTPNGDLALGGVVDYDPSLINLFFDKDELNMMLQDPQQNEAAKSAIQNAVESIDLPRKRTTSRPFSQAPVQPIRTKEQPLANQLALASPNFVRGYIILAKSHRQVFRSYELYEQSGALLGKGPIYRKRTIRVPWRAVGKVSLMLHGSAGSQSFQFQTHP